MWAALGKTPPILTIKIREQFEFNWVQHSYIFLLFLSLGELRDLQYAVSFPLETSMY